MSVKHDCTFTGKSQQRERSLVKIRRLDLWRGRAVLFGSEGDQVFGVVFIPHLHDLFGGLAGGSQAVAGGIQPADDF
jgi:hypothetical protein